MVLIYGADGKPITSRPLSAQYTGEKTGGELRQWTTFTQDANDFLTSSYDVLTRRCATLYHTSAIARACVNKPLTYSIGEGLVFKSAINAQYLGISEKKSKEWSRQFTELLHLEKLEDGYYDKQTLLAREAKITGDSVVYFLREASDEKPFDIIPAGGHVINWQKTDSKHIMGIVIDKYQRKLGFVGVDGSTTMFKDSDGNYNAIQFLFTDRPGQMRGLSCFYSEVSRAKGFDRIWDATIERMVQETIQLGWFNTSVSDPGRQAENMSRQALGISKSEDLSLISQTTDLKTGGMYQFQNGESMQFSDLKTPSNNFGMANEWTVKLFSMATGYPPEFISGQYPTSYTAHKGALNDAIKRYMAERMAFVRSVDYVVNLEYLKYFAATGQIKVIPAFWTDYKVQRAYLQGTVLGPVPGSINPLQEVNADIKADENGYVTKSQIAAKYGNDFNNQLSEWEAQQQAWYEASPAQQAEALKNDMENRDNNDNSRPVTENQEDDNA